MFKNVSPFISFSYDQTSFDTAIKKIEDPKLFFIDEAGNVQQPGQLRKIWEKFKSLIGQVDQTSQIQVNFRVIQLLEYGSEKGFLESEKIKEVLNRLDVFSTNENIDEVIKNIAAHAKVSKSNLEEKYSKIYFNNYTNEILPRSIFQKIFKDERQPAKKYTFQNFNENSEQKNDYNFADAYNSIHTKDDLISKNQKSIHLVTENQEYDSSIFKSQQKNDELFHLKVKNQSETKDAQADSKDGRGNTIKGLGILILSIFGGYLALSKESSLYKREVTADLSITKSSTTNSTTPNSHLPILPTSLSQTHQLEVIPFKSIKPVDEIEPPHSIQIQNAVMAVASVFVILGVFFKRVLEKSEELEMTEIEVEEEVKEEEVKEEEVKEEEVKEEKIINAPGRGVQEHSLDFVSDVKHTVEAYYDIPRHADKCIFGKDTQFIQEKAPYLIPASNQTQLTLKDGKSIPLVEGDWLIPILFKNAKSWLPLGSELTSNDPDVHFFLPSNLIGDLKKGDILNLEYGNHFFSIIIYDAYPDFLQNESFHFLVNRAEKELYSKLDAQSNEPAMILDMKSVETETARRKNYQPPSKIRREQKALQDDSTLLENLYKDIEKSEKFYFRFNSETQDFSHIDQSDLLNEIKGQQVNNIDIRTPTKLSTYAPVIDGEEVKLYSEFPELVTILLCNNYLIVWEKRKQNPNNRRIIFSNRANNFLTIIPINFEQFNSLKNNIEGKIKFDKGRLQVQLLSSDFNNKNLEKEIN